MPNPFNLEPRINLLDKEGNFAATVSQIVASRLLRLDAADLVLIANPTVKLRITLEEYIAFKDSGRKTIGWHNVLARTLYGNCRVLSPDNEEMFHCSNTKVLWYLNRGLVDIVKTDPPTVRLRFKPAGLGHKGDEYYLGVKINCCVVCGSKENLSRHHVVPDLYRQHMNEMIKNHSYHDILLNCVDCHEEYEVYAQQLKIKIAEEHGTKISDWFTETGEKVRMDLRKDKAVRAAISVVKYGDKMSEVKMNDMLQRIYDYLGYKADWSEIIELSKQDCRFKSGHLIKGFISHGKMVVGRLDTMDKVQGFVERWRSHFLEKMNPRYMPANWDQERVDSRRCLNARNETDTNNP